MRYLSFADPELTQYPVVLLVPSIRKDDILKHYFKDTLLKPEEMLVIQTHATPGKKKTPAAEIKAWITEELGPALLDINAEYLLVADAEYFKVLAKVSKVDPHLGYVMDCAYGPWKIIYVPNFQTVFYDPERVGAKIASGMSALDNHRGGSYVVPGNNVINFANYPQSEWAIQQQLLQLIDIPDLTADIEAFSLKHYDAGIGTIAFAWNQSEGIAFPVDYVPHHEKQEDGTYGFQQDNPTLKALLRDFFIGYRARGHKLKWHSIGYDVGVLIYQLFMDHLLDQEGLLYGMEILLGDDGGWDCTKLITYLATNSCAGNKLGLKDQSQEFAGNYAMEEIRDIRRIPLFKLLEYNLVDALATWYVYDKHWSTLVADQQLSVYQELFQPAMVDIIQMQLTGMPVNMAQVLEVDRLLTAIEAQAVDTINASRVVQHYNHILRQAHVEKRNAALKKKQITLVDDEVALVEFNPNSAPQLQDLLFEVLGLPVLGLTDTKLPATDGDTLKNLQNHTKDPDILEFLSALVDYKAVNKIITDFIPSLKNAQPGNDGWHYLFGNFNLGGTKSGRLSSSGPNLQNLPANVTMALSAAILQMYGEQLAKFIYKGRFNIGKLIKSCFEAPPGWIFAGLDFDSLEDRISALTTKDPQKLKVYSDGFDGHCLRAHSYFGTSMPDIEIAPPDVPCYKANVGEQIVYFHANETLEYLGKTMKGVELNELLTR